jgi:hypothetical protein
MTNGSNDWGVTFGIDQILRNHDNVANVNRERDILFTVNRRNQSDVLRVLCCEEYAFGVTLLNRALTEFGSLEIVYVGGEWNGYTVDAKEVLGPAYRLVQHKRNRRWVMEE